MKEKKGLKPHLELLVKLAYTLPTSEGEVTERTLRRANNWVEAYLEHGRKINRQATENGFPPENYITAYENMSRYLVFINAFGYADPEQRDQSMAGAISVLGRSLEDFKS